MWAQTWHVPGLVRTQEEEDEEEEEEERENKGNAVHCLSCYHGDTNIRCYQKLSSILTAVNQLVSAPHNSPKSASFSSPLSLISKF